LARSLANALQYCHDLGFVVRDITPSNLMVKSVGRNMFELQIVDLCAAAEDGAVDNITHHPLYQRFLCSNTSSSSGSKSPSSNGSSTSGMKKIEEEEEEESDADEESEDKEVSAVDVFDNVRYYLPPESVYSTAPCSCAGDMWALGVLVYLLVSGQMVFDLSELVLLGDEEPQSPGGGANSDTISSRLFREEVWATVSPRLKDFVGVLLNPNAEQRLSSAKALRHPFLLLGP
jgi:serine/threonine protein kinase